MSIDLLDRLTQDARIRAARSAERRKPEWNPSPYSEALASQLHAESKSLEGTADTSSATAPSPRVNPQLKSGAPAIAAESSIASAFDGPGETSAITRSPATRLPRALILITMETFCTSCGARYRAPGYAILAEYGPNNVSVNRTMDDVRRLERQYALATNGGLKLLREHRTQTVHAPACERCF